MGGIFGGARFGSSVEAACSARFGLSGVPEKVRVLFTNEPRSYRGAIATAVRMLRPEIQVFEGEPESLHRDIQRFRPHLVVSSVPMPAAAELAWIELYPGHTSTAIVQLNGHHWKIEDASLVDLLSVLDRVRESVLSGRSLRDDTA